MDAAKGAPKGSWLARMMAKKPRMLVAIALANKMARGIWAMLTKQEGYRVRRWWLLISAAHLKPVRRGCEEGMTAWANDDQIGSGEPVKTTDFKLAVKLWT